MVSRAAMFFLFTPVILISARLYTLFNFHGKSSSRSCSSQYDTKTKEKKK